MVFAPEIGLDRMRSQGDTHHLKMTSADRSNEFTPFFGKMLNAEADLASDSRCLEVHTQTAQDAVFGCSKSMNSMGSCDFDLDPLAQCLAEIEDS